MARKAYPPENASPLLTTGVDYRTYLVGQKALLDGAFGAAAEGKIAATTYAASLVSTSSSYREEQVAI
jgi:hypothetical protein